MPKGKDQGGPSNPKSSVEILAELDDKTLLDKLRYLTDSAWRQRIEYLSERLRDTPRSKIADLLSIDLDVIDFSDKYPEISIEFSRLHIDPDTFSPQTKDRTVQLISESLFFGDNQRALLENFLPRAPLHRPGINDEIRRLHFINTVRDMRSEALFATRTGHISAIKEFKNALVLAMVEHLKHRPKPKKLQLLITEEINRRYEKRNEENTKSVDSTLDVLRPFVHAETEEDLAILDGIDTQMAERITNVKKEARLGSLEDEFEYWKKEFDLIADEIELFIEQQDDPRQAIDLLVGNSLEAFFKP